MHVFKFVILMALMVMVVGQAQAAVELSFGTEPGNVGFFNHNNHPEAEEPIPLGPLAFRVAGNGDVWIADSVRGRIVQIDATGKMLSSFEATKEKQGLLEDLALDLDVEGAVIAVWVLVGHEQKVKKFSPQGQELLSFGGRDDAPGSFLQMHRVEVSPQGHVFVADKARQTISVFDREGTLVREVPWQWSGLAVDAAGNLARLVFHADKEMTHLVIESPAGAAVSDTPLAIGPHADPELWFVTKEGGAVLTYTPVTGFKEVFTLFVSDATGAKKRAGDLKPPVAMNRFLDGNADGKLFLVDANYGEAPKGTFRVGAYELP